MAKRTLPTACGTASAPMTTTMDEANSAHKPQQLTQQHDNGWGELYELDATESYSTDDDYSDMSDEDAFEAECDARYQDLRVEMRNEGENNQNRINFFPKRHSMGQIHQHSTTIPTTTTTMAPTLRQHGSLPELLAHRIRNADLVVGDNAGGAGKVASSVPRATAGGASATVTPTGGPATAALEQEDPRHVYARILEKHGVSSTVRKGADLTGFFIEMGEANVTGYTMDKVTAVRREDVAALRTMRQSGQTLQVCNQFGESILHSACRRGLGKVLRFLVDEAHVSLAVADDYGKTPAHDACWTIQPNFEVVKIVIETCPDLMLVADMRGSTPLDYTQKSLWGDWCAFLREHENLLLPKTLNANEREDQRDAEEDK